MDARRPAAQHSMKDARRQDTSTPTRGRRQQQEAAAFEAGVERRQIVATSIDFLLTSLALAFWALG